MREGAIWWNLGEITDRRAGIRYKNSRSVYYRPALLWYIYKVKRTEKCLYMGRRTTYNNAPGLSKGGEGICEGYRPARSEGV